MSRVFISLACVLCVVLSVGTLANAQQYKAERFVSWTTGAPNEIGQYITPVTPNVRFAPGPASCTVTATLQGNIQQLGDSLHDSEIISGYIMTPSGFKCELRMTEQGNRHQPIPRNQDTTHVFYNVDLRSGDPLQFPYVQGAVLGMWPGEGAFWDGGRYDIHAEQGATPPQK